MSPVLDASVFVAALSPSETHHDRARGLMEGHSDVEVFIVPALFRVEVIAAFSRRGEDEALLELVEALICGPRFHAVPMDKPLLDRATMVAKKAGLRAYDAVYVALALLHDAPLYTLDGELLGKLPEIWPELRLNEA
jgi:predicted nucleic acid-binding protein